MTPPLRHPGTCGPVYKRACEIGGSGDLMKHRRKASVLRRRAPAQTVSGPKGWHQGVVKLAVMASGACANSFRTKGPAMVTFLAGGERLMASGVCTESPGRRSGATPKGTVLGWRPKVSSWGGLPGMCTFLNLALVREVLQIMGRSHSLDGCRP